MYTAAEFGIYCTMYYSSQNYLKMENTLTKFNEFFFGGGADSRVRMGRFPDVSETNFVPHLQGVLVIW